MSHTIAPSLPRRRTQAGHLLERPSPARITAIAGVIALHAAAFVLLLMPMAPPQALPTPEVEIQYVLIEKKETKPVEPPQQPIERIRQTTTTTPREVRIEQPPVVDPVGEEVAPPYDPNPDTAIVIETPPTVP